MKIFEGVFIILTLPIAIFMNWFIRTGLGDKVGSTFPYRPRILNWIWATWGGLFWLPCPICNNNFGGHEWGESLMETMHSGQGVCTKCGEEAKKINKLKYGYNWQKTTEL